MTREFRASIANLSSSSSQVQKSDAKEMLEEKVQDFAEVVGLIGGNVAGWQKRKFRKSLTELLPEGMENSSG